MKDDGRLSFFERIVGGKARRAPEQASPVREAPMADATAFGSGRLTGSELEHAYRKLLLDNQVLTESNERLNERLARRVAGLQDSPATQELMRMQRNALVERSHRLRELEYQYKQLERQHAKLIEENRRLKAGLAQRTEDARPHLEREAQLRRELEQATAELRHKNNQLLALTDRYYQLQARLKPNSAANSRF